MSRTIPPTVVPPSGSPQEPKRPAGAAPAAPAGPAAPASKPATPGGPKLVIKPLIPGTKPPALGPGAPRPAGATPATKPSAPGTPPAPPKPPAPPGAAGGGQTPPPAPPGDDAPAPNIAELKGRPIGRVLTKMGKVTREQVVEALDFQKRKGGALGRILIDLGYIKDADLNFGLAAQRGYELVSLEGKQIPSATIAAVPAQIATTNKVLPIEFDPATKKLKVAMASPENFRALDDLRALMGYDVQAVLADPDQIDKLVAKHYN